MKHFIILLLIFSACSHRLHVADPEASKPSWLKTEPFQDGYYTGIGHSIKDGSNNYIQAAKRSALDDLVSEIKVTVSSTSVLSTLEVDKKLQEQYKQMIQTTAKDEIEDFELVDAWEDEKNYWVYYRLSVSAYKKLKEDQKRNATTLATDYLKKGRQSEKFNDYIQSLTYYFQAFRSIEKYLGEAILINLEGNDVLLVNEIHASIQRILADINIETTPKEVALNRRVIQSTASIIVQAQYAAGKPVVALPLRAVFEKGSGDLFPDYKTNEEGKAKVLLTKINSRDLEQVVSVSLNLDAFSGSHSSGSAVYQLMLKTFRVPEAKVMLQVQRPVVYLTAEEKSLGFYKSGSQLTNKLKNLLTSNGFEFTDERESADLWFDVKANSERGSVSGSIYITYLTSVIRVTALKEGKEIYETTLDRIKGYGLDYDKSSVDAYNKAQETLEKERISEILASVLQ